ncbi:unnamed protein product [Caenorhabditis angaria]|uniref:Uncharacterized protein n=1 Tax=Caenorhabditis angaria TaxID=860376 RepID=A0A9P1IKZ2_9PELO|nr:unnamed protein product [Caenorhabditis angaria]
MFTILPIFLCFLPFSTQDNATANKLSKLVESALTQPSDANCRKIFAPVFVMREIGVSVEMFDLSNFIKDRKPFENRWSGEKIEEIKVQGFKRSEDRIMVIYEVGQGVEKRNRTFWSQNDKVYYVEK